MKTNWVLIAITATFTLMLSVNTHTYAWHENLGIDATKAAELYQTKPNDPTIVQWKNALQTSFNQMEKCYNIQYALFEANSCYAVYSTIISNCNSHPNELLVCNDKRLVNYPSVLNATLKEQKRLQETPVGDLVKEFTSNLTQHNSTIIPNSNLTGNSSSSNSTHP